MAGIDRRVKPPTVRDIREFGGVAGNDGSTDQSAAFAAALASVPPLPGSDWLAAGLRITVPPGTYTVNNVAFDRTKARILFDCAGKGSTVFMRTGDNFIFDISGTADDAASVIKRVKFRGCSMTSSSRSQGVWTVPLIRCYYAQFVHWEDVDFYRAGGSAIAGVRYYDAQFQNCRWDYCGSTGNAAIHMMCSEQGLTPGQFGHSTDSCNNLYFADCTIEQCPSSIYLDGRQSDGSLNASRRINLCRFKGVKVENQIDTERSDDALVRIENAAHTTIESLVCSANGTQSGNVTDWLHLKSTYNTKIGHLTLAATETAASRMRSGLKLEATTGTKADLVTGTVQTNNKPTVALVEFSGTNNGVGIDRAYYDNNPGSAALYDGTPTTWIGDRSEEQPVVPAFSTRAAFMGTRAMGANTAYYTRFTVNKPIKVTALAYNVTTASGTNDNVQVGIFNADLSVLLGSSVSTAGKLNNALPAGARQSVSLQATVQLNPGTVYYAAIWASAVGATITGVATSGGNTTAHQVEDALSPSGVAPNVWWTSKTGIGGGLAAAPASPVAAVGSSAALWLVPA